MVTIQNGEENDEFMGSMISRGSPPKAAIVKVTRQSEIEYYTQAALSEQQKRNSAINE
jgi:hypothetical protein